MKGLQTANKFFRRKPRIINSQDNNTRISSIRDKLRTALPISYETKTKKEKGGGKK